MADTPQVEVPIDPPSAQLIDTHDQVQVVILALPTPDIIKPIVGNFLPALGSNIPSTQPISFTVTDDSGAFVRIIVHARFADGLEEVVHNGDSFRGLYGGGASSRILAAGGFGYTVFRTGGWPQGAPVALNVFAIDAAGNEAA